MSDAAREDGSMTDAVDQVANALRVRWVADHAAHPAPYDEDLEAWFWRGMASVAGAARDALTRARDIAGALEAELADLRRAIEAIHVPKQVSNPTYPDDPFVICAMCREDFPCETRSFSDRLDPINTLDGDDLGPDPF